MSLWAQALVKLDLTLDGKYSSATQGQQIQRSQLGAESVQTKEKPDIYLKLVNIRQLLNHVPVLFQQMWFELPSPPIPHTSIVSKLPFQSHVVPNFQKPSASQQGYLSFSECNVHFKFLFFYFTLFNSFYAHPTFQAFQMLTCLCEALLTALPFLPGRAYTPFSNAPRKHCLVFHSPSPDPCIDAPLFFSHTCVRFLSTNYAVEK